MGSAEGKDAVDRPLLQENERLQELTKIWSERKDYYKKTAHIILNTDGQSPNDISEDIFKQVLLWNPFKWTSEVAHIQSM